MQTSGTQQVGVPLVDELLVEVGAKRDRVVDEVVDEVLLAPQLPLIPPVGTPLKVKSSRVSVTLAIGAVRLISRSMRCGW